MYSLILSVLLLNIFSIQYIIFIFIFVLLLLFLSVLGTLKFSTALISLTGIVVLYSVFLLFFGIGFLSATIGTIYAGAILVLVLFVLILIEQAPFSNFKTKIEENKSENAFTIMLNGALFIFIVQFLKNKFILTNSKISNTANFENQEAAFSNFYFYLNSELYNLATIIFKFHGFLFYAVGLYIVFTSVFVVNLLKKLYN